MSAKATMQTLPCGHRVVCRKCFIKTIQSAIADHALPLKCIVCRASVLKLGSNKNVEKSSSTQQQLSATPSRSSSSRRTVGSVPTRAPHHPRGMTAACAGPAASRGLTVGPATAAGELSRQNDAGRPPEVSSAAAAAAAARFRESSSSHRAAAQRGCCNHHQIPLRQLHAHQDAGAAAAAASCAAGGGATTKITKLQPMPVYPARGSAPTQRRAFSAFAAASPPPEVARSPADAKDCAPSSSVRAAAVAAAAAAAAPTGHRAS